MKEKRTRASQGGKVKIHENTRTKKRWKGQGRRGQRTRDKDKG